MTGMMLITLLCTVYILNNIRRHKGEVVESPTHVASSSDDVANSGNGSSSISSVGASARTGTSGPNSMERPRRYGHMSTGRREPKRRRLNHTGSIDVVASTYGRNN